MIRDELIDAIEDLFRACSADADAEQRERARAKMEAAYNGASGSVIVAAMRAELSGKEWDGWT